MALRDLEVVNLTAIWKKSGGTSLKARSCGGDSVTLGQDIFIYLWIEDEEGVKSEAGVGGLL